MRVIGPGPDAKFGDESDVDVVTFFDRRYTGRIGRVVGYTSEGDEAGVGDSPKDPAFRVRFGPAFGMKPGYELFWAEELERVRR